MCKISLAFLVASLFSLGAADFCLAQFRLVDGKRGFPHHRFERSKGYRVPISLPDGRVLRPEEAKTILGIIKNDFLVNDDTTGGCSQWYPVVAMDLGGDFVICWQDERNGGWGNPDIYGQWYSSSGNTQGTNFRVNDDVGTSSQKYPSIATDADGDFVICWQDYRNGGWDIYAQRYSSSGDAQSTNFRVNDDVGTNGQLYSSIAMDADGDFVIGWQDYRNGDWDIYAQRYSSSGDTQGTNFRVNDDMGTSIQGSPSVSMDVDGDFVICWEDSRKFFYNPDIYAQRYSSSGDTQGTNFRVNDDVGTSWQEDPSVSMDADGNFVICWEDKRNGDWDIYAQRYSSSGDTQDTNFRVNDDMGTSIQGSPSVSMDVDGDFVVCWQDGRNGNRDIYAQRYRSSGDTSGANFRVNDDIGTAYQGFPSIAVDVDGDFVICWQDGRNGNYYDIYAQLYGSSGDTSGTNFRVNDIGTSDQWFPSIVMDVDGDFVICWQDGRNDNRNPDIYGQRYSSLGDTLGVNFRVNDDVGTSDQWYPSIAMDGDGDFIICWQDERNGDRYPHIYGQRYNSLGDTLGANFRVNDDAGTSGQGSPSLAMDGDGDFVICWVDDRNDCWGDIYAQRYSSSGDTLGANFKVDDDVGSSCQCWPSIAMDAGGDFVICWYDCRNDNPDIYAQRYSSLGNTLGVNFRVNDDAGTSDRGWPSISIDGDGNFVICWHDYRNGDADIYAQRYSSLGDTLGANFRVNDDAGTNDQRYPSIALDGDGNFVICWHDYRNGNADIYAQRYHSDGTPLGTTYLVNQRPDVSNLHQWHPSVALSEDRITFAWMDGRRSKGWDIYAKVVTWDWDKVDEPGDDDLGLPKDFALSQNYPNPFNATTVIRYSLIVDRPIRTTLKNYSYSGEGSSRSTNTIHVSLKIYNILGQEVKTLVDKEQPASNYRILWDGRDSSGKDVSSGVYFYRLKVEGQRLKVEKTKKMVLIR